MFVFDFKRVMESLPMKSKTVVPFKSNAGISYALMNRLLSRGEKYGLNAIFPFNPDKIIVSCSYPEACRFPQEKRPAVESFSIDVIGTLHNLETNSTVATNLDDNFTYFSIILLE